MGSNAETSKPRPSPWPLIVQMLIGIALVAGGAVYARALDLAAHVRIDFTGVRTRGTVERLDPEKPLYRLSYRHPSGAVYSTTRKGWFGFSDPGATPTELSLVYDPQEPKKFQPAGVSYVPAGFVFIVMAMGLTFVAAGNRQLQKMYRRSRSDP